MAFLKRQLKKIYKDFLPSRLRTLFDIYPTLRIYNDPDKTLTEKKILVIAPHPDDEVIGCGGTIHMYHLNKADITSVFLTDGRKGNERYIEEELVLIRREEAKKAAAITGIDRLIFMENRDSELSNSSIAGPELISILNEIRPGAVFLPFFMDSHPDHSAANRILYESERLLPQFICYAYPVWTPLPFFNLNVDITPYVDIKKRSIEQYQSQLEAYNYVDASLGLSRYYSIHEGGRKGNGWSEVFFVCRSSEYMRVLRAAGW